MLVKVTFILIHHVFPMFSYVFPYVSRVFLCFPDVFPHDPRSDPLHYPILQIWASRGPGRRKRPPYPRELSPAEVEMPWVNHVYVQVCVYIYIYIYIYIYVYMYMYSCVQLYTVMCSYVQLCMYVCLSVCLSGWMDGWMDAYIYIYVYIVILDQIEYGILRLHLLK